MKATFIALLAVLLCVGCGGPSAPDISIHEAAHKGNIEAVKKHSDPGTDVNALDKDGLTSLHHAAAEGHKEVVELLIANDADVNAKSDFRTPLAQAIHSNIPKPPISPPTAAFNR